MKVLDLELITESGSRGLSFPVKRMINAGYVGRDRESVQAHIDELRRQGVPPPPTVPLFLPVLSHNVTTEGTIEVIGDQTSGEAEFVLLLDGDDCFVGVGSDHTDRAVEAYSIVTSKQICSNVISRQVWRYEDVESFWDDLSIRSWVRPSKDREPVLYQDARLGSILSPEQLIEMVKSTVHDGSVDGCVLYSGTVPVLTEEVIYGHDFLVELLDPRRDRKLTSYYRVSRLTYITDFEGAPAAPEPGSTAGS